MNKQIVSFRADGQILQKTDHKFTFAANIVSYIDAEFDLGEDWDGFDAVRAVWQSTTDSISMVLDNSGKCEVPAEVLRYPSRVLVNLVGSTSVGTTLEDRLTTYPVVAFTVDKDAKLEGTETPVVTPSQFEQYVGHVRGYWESIQDYSDDSEAWAIGKRKGEDVSEDDETYHNNSKYWSEQSHAHENESKGYAQQAHADLIALNEHIAENVDEWLFAHPEATTTVTDGSLTEAKFSETLKLKTIKDYVTPEMFGAKGDGETDDTSAFQDAIDYALANRMGLLAEHYYLITETLYVAPEEPRTTDMMISNVFNVTGSILSSISDAPVIVFNGCHGWDINVNARASVQTNYYGGYDFEDIADYHYGILPNVGVVLKNCNRCDFSGFIRNFNVGLRLLGVGAGCVYNFIHGVSVWNCAYGIELYAHDTGWVNNNRFVENTVAINSAATDKDKPVAVHITSNYNYQNNCNLFEGDYMSEDNYVWLLIECGMYNQFLIRNEGNCVAIIDDDDANAGNNFNVIEYNYNCVADVDGVNGCQAVIDKMLDSYLHLVSYKEPDIDTVFWKSSGNSYYLCTTNCLKYGREANGVFTDSFYDTSASSIGDNKGYVPSGIGAFIKLGDDKTVAVKMGGLSTDEMRMYLYLFDSSKQLITNPIDYFKHCSLGGTIFQPTGKPYLTNGASAHNKTLAFVLKSDVKYIFVTPSAKWSSLDVYVKKTSQKSYKPDPRVEYFADNYQYPYLPISNTNIVTLKPRVGKRLYSTVDGAEYVCTAVAGDGTETWTKKTV